MTEKKKASSHLAAKQKSKSATGGRKDAKTAASSALSQRVSTRREKDGKPVRVVLAPISSGSLKREEVSRAVNKILLARKK